MSLKVCNAYQNNNKNFRVEKFWTFCYVQHVFNLYNNRVPAAASDKQTILKPPQHDLTKR